MPTLTTPLFGSYNQRSFATVSGKDQLFKACFVTKVINKATNSATYYVEKRNGIGAGFSTPSAGNAGTLVFVSVVSAGIIISAFGASNSTIYSGTTNIGAITGIAIHINEVNISSIYWIITSSDGTVWFLQSTASAQTSYTVTTHTTTIVDGIASTAGMYAGQAVSGSGIQAGTRIASVDSVNQITLTLAATASATITLTKTPIAKIIDADFPTTVYGQVQEMDGYLFALGSDGYVFNSDLNSVISWQASNKIASNISTDPPVGLVKSKNYILVLSQKSGEFFYNAGNASGSILNSAPQLAFGVGCQGGTSFKTIVKVKDDVFWISFDDFLYKLEGTQPRRISPEGIVLGGHNLDSFSYANQTWLHIQATTVAGSYWYSIDNDFFCDPILPDVAHLDGFISPVSGLFPKVVLEGATGKVYSLGGSNSVFTDDGAPYTMSIQIATDMGTDKRKFSKSLRLIADTQTSGNVAVSWSDDDGSSFSTTRNIDLTKMRKELTRLGSWEGTRIWKFEDSGNNANRIKQVEIDYEVAA